MRLRKRSTAAALAIAICWPLLTAGSCASTGPAEPVIQIREVKVPVAVKCAADPGPDPAYADAPAAVKATADIFERVKLLLAGRDQRDARLAELKASAAGCR